MDLFLALGANEGNVIVDSIYAITDPFVAPFRGIFSIDRSARRAERVRCRRAAGDHRLDLVALLIAAILRIPDRSAA